MAKVDLKKEWHQLYKPSANKISIVDVPPIRFLMIDGHGDPNKSAEFQGATDALYGVSYTIKFMVKKDEPALDYVVMPLEGLWWASDPEVFRFEIKDDWSWTLMIAQPAHVDEQLVDRALVEARRKKGDSGFLSRLRFELYHEGLSAQLMHVGPYSTEQSTVQALHDYIRTNGYRLHGKHHEIYLGDPRRSRPENLKTIIRQPIVSD